MPLKNKMFKMIKILFRINLLKVGLFCIDSGASIVCFVFVIIKYLNPTLWLDMKLKKYIIRIRDIALVRESMFHMDFVLFSPKYTSNLKRPTEIY